jgi:hypothetical protein
MGVSRKKRKSSGLASLTLSASLAYLGLTIILISSIYRFSEKVWELVVGREVQYASSVASISEGAWFTTLLLGVLIVVMALAVEIVRGGSRKV